MKFDDNQYGGAKRAFDGEKEREKRSWREIDQKRSKKDTHHDQVYARGKKIEQTHAYRAYKSQLSKLFDAACVQNEAVTQQTSQTAKTPITHKQVADTPEVLPPRHALMQAETEADIHTAAQRCVTEGGLPKDSELLAKVLTLKDQTLVFAAIEMLLEVLERGRPRNAALLGERLRSQMALLNDTHMRALAEGILLRLKA